MKQHSIKCASNEKIVGHGIDTDGSQSCDCDGYHTFGELYDHRIALWIAISKLMAQREMAIGRVKDMPYVWRSKRHSDGELSFGGTWFVLGVGFFEGDQMTYHLPIEKWDMCDFAETLEKAPEFDGHTSDDVLERLKTI
jgi:hypothetical protein